ncbi:hypothetical protein [Fibrella arboris]|uniref:hypothetical protein n=1 Tax=Fibrella arboris TaxID=3242486 RepID=UPI00352240CA
MLRLLIDKASDGHSDLFLKIDVTPSYLKVADSYYLAEFLELTDEEIGAIKEEEWQAYKATKLINHWIERIKSLEKGQKTFLLYDFSDQYVGGMQIEKNKRGFLISFVYTTDLQGYGVGVSGLDKRLGMNDVVMKPSTKLTWLISEAALFNGLTWSLEQLSV